MKNIDLIECAMRRLDLQYNVPFKLLNNKELYKIIKEDNNFRKEINLFFCNEFTHGEFKKDGKSKLFNVLFGNSIICKKCYNLDWINK